VLLDEADDDDELVVLLVEVVEMLESGTFLEVDGTSLLAESVLAHASNAITSIESEVIRTNAETFIFLPS